jgi:hypothetical protein
MAKSEVFNSLCSNITTGLGVGRSPTFRHMPLDGHRAVLDKSLWNLDVRSWFD